MRYLEGVAKITYDSGRCTGCTRCTEVCPHGVFVMREGRAVLSESELCIECGACMRNCASGAIHVESGVGCAAALINAMITGGEPSCDCSGGISGNGGSGGSGGCC